MHLGYIEKSLIRSDILGLFVNTLTADNMYSRCLIISEINVHNFADQKFKCHYLNNEKTFSGFFLAFLKCAWNLEHFEKKDEYPSLIISEIMDCERGVYLNV